MEIDSRKNTLACGQYTPLRMDSTHPCVWTAHTLACGNSKINEVVTNQILK
jgi:hypothetical protein